MDGMSSIRPGATDLQLRTKCMNEKYMSPNFVNDTFSHRSWQMPIHRFVLNAFLNLGETMCTEGNDKTEHITGYSWIKYQEKIYSLGDHSGNGKVTILRRQKKLLKFWEDGHGQYILTETIVESLMSIQWRVLKYWADIFYVQSMKIIFSFFRHYDRYRYLSKLISVNRGDIMKLSRKKYFLVLLLTLYLVTSVYIEVISKRSTERCKL